MAKQVENEHQRAAEFLKEIIQSRLNELDVILQGWARVPSIAVNDYSDVKNLTHTQLKNSQLIEQIFLVYKENNEYFFPLHPGARAEIPTFSLPSLSPAQMDIFSQAEKNEFRLQKFQTAASLYQTLFSTIKNRDAKGLMLNNTARCHVKLENYEKAVDHYLKICKDFPDCKTPNGIPLVLIARMQILDGLIKQNKFETALRSSLDFYRDILEEPWDLTENQFKTYSTLAEEAITDLFSKELKVISTEEIAQEFERLKVQYQEKQKKWQAVNDIIEDIIPELQDDLFKSEEFNPAPRHISRTINNRDYLISSLLIPDESGLGAVGTLSAKINTDYLINKIVYETIQRIQPGEKNTHMNIVLTTSTGEIVYGQRNPLSPVRTFSETFANNYPPWRMEFYHGRAVGFGILDLMKNFYFWTIIILILILAFGAILIGRTIAHEMEIQKIKSAFVSSVSHEFKTPLTSIKTLIERLQDGKVKNPAKMNEYFSMISQGTDKLIRLVKNILDSSKIDEGKIEYDFVETDIGLLLSQLMEDFKKDAANKRIPIHTHIQKDIRPVSVDRDTMTQAILNLLDNAVKFSPDRKEMDVDVREKDEHVVLAIKDQGIGIHPDETDKIFDKFYQGRNTPKQASTGTGLGLALVKHIVEDHGGKISVESQIGKGSTFSVILPYMGKSP
ncbi:MAG: HAMP domain-containing histidine kinase [Candidatus Aminicenantes bacterium]|nr:HAMP domain-containing histidine kinase [Candidatus Aminicenantes bacterium]